MSRNCVWKALSEEEIVQKVWEQNLFQYPTEKLLKNKVWACIRRLNALDDVPALTDILANGSASEAKLAALIAMMLKSALLAEFMVSVIGEKYRTLDPTLSRKDLSLFFFAPPTAGCWGGRMVGFHSREDQDRDPELPEGDRLHQGMRGKACSTPVFLPEHMAQALRSAGLQAFLPALNVFYLTGALQMDSIEKRLDRIRARFSDEGFLTNKGLSNEVGLYIFSYSPQDEMAVRAFLTSLKNEVNAPASTRRILHYDLYDVLLDILQSRRLLGSHSSKGSADRAASPPGATFKRSPAPEAYVERLRYDDHRKGDIVLISGVGQSLSVHALPQYFEQHPARV